MDHRMDGIFGSSHGFRLQLFPASHSTLKSDPIADHVQYDHRISRIQPIQHFAFDCSSLHRRYGWLLACSLLFRRA